MSFMFGRARPQFYKVSFDAGELDALQKACSGQSEREDVKLGEAASGGLEDVVVQETVADDMLLIKDTVKIFKPGQSILITREDLDLIRKCLENHKAHATEEQYGSIDSAIKKIDEAVSC